MKKAELESILLFHKEGHISSYVYVYARRKDFPTATQNGMIEIIKGEKCGISYAGKKGQEALQHLLTFELFDLIVEAQDNRAVQTDKPDLMEIADVLQFLDYSIRNLPLEQLSKGGGCHLSMSEIVHLTYDVQRLMEKYCGSNIANDIEGIAEMVPPDEKPGEFLESIKELATMTIKAASKRDKLLHSLKELATTYRLG